MVIPSGYKHCKRCKNQFKKWSSKDTANYCPNCNTSRLKRQETSELSPKTRFPTKTKEREKKQEKKITLNKKYWEAQEKRKDPDYLLLNEEKKEKHPLWGFKTPRAFEDAKNKTPYINKSGKWVKHSKRKIPKLVIRYDNHLPKNRKRIK